MDADTLRILVAFGIFVALLLLRLEAPRFRVAEYAESIKLRDLPARLAWYAIGLALLGVLSAVHPAPHDVLDLLVGHAADVVLYGALLAACGLALAASLAWLRYGYLRLAAPGEYPGAALNSIATAVIDEATFRGVLLGTLLSIGLPGGWSVLVSTIVYMLAIRAVAPGRHYSMPAMAICIGAAGGWATVVTGGIGAAIIGHAVASFALFVFTGHAGQIPRGGREPEELASWQRPAGWVDARLLPWRGSAALPAYEPIEQSGFSNRAERAGSRGGAGRRGAGRGRGDGAGSGGRGGGAARGTAAVRGRVDRAAGVAPAWASRIARLMSGIVARVFGPSEKPVMGPAAARAAAGHESSERIGRRSSARARVAASAARSSAGHRRLAERRPPR